MKKPPPPLFGKDNVNARAKVMHKISLDNKNPDLVIIGKYGYGFKSRCPTITIPVNNAWVKKDHIQFPHPANINATLQGKTMYVKTGKTYDVFNISEIVYKVQQQGGTFKFMAFQMDERTSVPKI